MKPAEKAKIIFSNETLNGLESTIREFIGAVKVVFEESLNEGAQPFYLYSYTRTRNSVILLE